MIIATLNMNVFQDVAKKNYVQLQISAITAASAMTIAKNQTVAVTECAPTTKYA